MEKKTKPRMAEPSLTTNANVQNTLKTENEQKRVNHSDMYSSCHIKKSEFGLEFVVTETKLPSTDFHLGG